MQDALVDAEHEVDRVDALLTAAEGVGGRIDGASRLVTRTVTNPVVKVARDRHRAPSRRCAASAPVSGAPRASGR